MSLSITQLYTDLDRDAIGENVSNRIKLAAATLCADL
jgi:hypothetical protein